jgi:glycosyltransferase involved in cell wall biosynthesis
VTIGIRWLSVGPTSGYGDASEAYLSGLRAAGVPVSWTPLGWHEGVWSQAFGPRKDPDVTGLIHADIVNVAIEHDTVVVAAPPLWNDQLAAEAAGRRLVAYTTWETDRIPDEWLEVLGHYDVVLVPSVFNRDTFVASGLGTPVRVVPHIARPSDPMLGEAGNDGDSRFVFYTVASWTARKAVLDTVDAFVNAFGADDDVVLVIHTSAVDHIAQARPPSQGAPGGRRNQTWYTLAGALAGRSDLANIVLSTRTLDRAGIEALHERGDCFVSLSRGEGWGLGALDAGNRGNPIVVTGWGGTLDMLPPGYPYCADYDLVPTSLDAADDWWSPRRGERWAKVRVAHAATLLRHVYEHRAEARQWGGRLQATIRSRFDSAPVTRGLLHALASEADAPGSDRRAARDGQGAQSAPLEDSPPAERQH